MLCVDVLYREAKTPDSLRVVLRMRSLVRWLPWCIHQAALLAGRDGEISLRKASVYTPETFVCNGGGFESDDKDLNRARN